MVRLGGAWSLKGEIPAADTVVQALESDAGLEAVTFDAAALTQWDSGLLTFLVACMWKLGRGDLEGAASCARTFAEQCDAEKLG